MAEITDKAITNFTDLNLAQRATYYYIMYVVNNVGLLSDVNQVSGTTLPGLPYPFQDDMEAGGGNWTPGGSWALITPDEAHSGNNVWMDSPGGDYPNNSETSLTLAGDITITAATQLVFWHQLALLTGDSAFVEVSTDSGGTWTTLASYADITIARWTRVQISLGAYSATPVTLRFRLLTDATGAADGWQIDDVTMSDKPTEVTLATPTPLTGTDAGKMSLSWSENTDTSFLAYEIHRTTDPGVTLSSPLVATITARGTTTFTDIGLDPNKVYYYRLFVVNGYYAYSDGSNEVSQKPVGYFSDDAESGEGTFAAESPWARTTENAHSGIYSWTDSPGTTYANNTSKSLQFPVNLSGAIMPYLGFWHNYSFETNSDYGFVEISTDNGTNWTKLFFVTGSSAEWRSETIDLTVYAGLNILLRFRLQSDNNGTVSDGWHIDDVTVSESSAPIPYPLADNMDNEPTTRANWLGSSWDLKSDSHSNPFSWTDSPAGNYAAYVNSSLVLAGAIDLTNAVHPQLTFWHKYSFYYETGWWGCECDYGKVYVSDYYGQTGTWREVASFSGSQGSWKQEQIDLSAVASLSKVRVKFLIQDNTQPYYGNNRQADGWYIDDVEISDAPTDVVLSTPTGVTMHGATLTWTRNTDSDFKQYEIYRDTSSSVSRANTLVATITNQATTTFTDTPYFLLRPDKFYYRVYVKDTTGQYGLGSNVVSADYIVPTVGYPSYPFTDGAESGPSSWQYGGLWSITSAQNHTTGGSNSFTDSPDANYPDNANYSMDTTVNLSGTNSPVLTFWHKYVFEDGADFGYVEVSTNQGSSWTTLLTVTGQNAVWNQERINLTAYAGNAALWLRFRLSSNASANYDGWYIDDISIAENTVVNSYPLADDMESGVGKWFYDSPWELTTANAHSGTTSWADSPGSSYAKNANFSLGTIVNLSNSTMPVLSFWHQYSFEANHGYGFVEVSNDNGANWTKLYFVTGQAAEWRQVFIDLANYAGDILYIRFRVVDDGNGTMADGWYLDDITVSEATGIISYPFVDNMDNEATTRANWISSNWDLKTDYHSSPLSWTDSPLGNYGANVSPSLVLAEVIDLTTAVKPQLTFWHKYAFYYETGWWGCECDYGKVYVSDYYGQSGTWNEVASFNGSQSTWKQVQIDLSAYAGLSKVRVKFVLVDSTQPYYGNNRQADGWYVDDVEISDAPQDVSLSSATGVTLHGATLNWTANTESDFNRYEIYRNTSTGVNLSSQLIATITDPAAITYTDTPYMILRPGAFSYRVYAVDNTNIYSLGSNVVTATYTVPVVSFPFSEDAESGAANWQMGYTWGITDSQAYTGVYSITDSPDGNYPDNADYSLDTTVDLSGANTPVLIFWHSYVFEPGVDFGYVQVSTNQGTSWTTLLTARGQSMVWKQQRIDLHLYAGNANLWLRFRIVSNGSINYDGWYLDDISIAEGLVVNPYPLSDDSESGIEGWFYDSPWGRTDSYAHSGTWSWTDSPGSTYVDNVDTSLVTSVNLVGSTMPMLTFWQQYSLEANHDYAFVEVSIDKGATWTKLYFTTGSAASWVKEKIDLTSYAGREISLRFRVTSDGNGVVSDGWYVDDITIEEAPYGSLASVPYPFSDNMDDPASSDGYWISSSWERVVNGRSLPNSWHDSPQGNYYPGMKNSSLVLGGVINLKDTTNPQLTFWHKYAFYYETGWWGCECDYGKVYASAYYGQPGTWREVGSFYGSQGSWKYERIDLSAFKGVEAVRVMFVIEDNTQPYYGNNRQSDGWWIDDIRMGEKTVITQENSRLVKPNTTVTYAHTIINYSTLADTFNLAAVSNHGWTVTLYQDTNGNGILDSDESTVVTDTGSLAAGASYFIIAQVQVPWTGAGTIDTTTVTATSTNDPYLSSGVADITTVDTVWGVAISPDTTGLGIPGATASIAHTVTNSGNESDYFYLSAASTENLPVRLYHDANGNGIVDSSERTSPVSVTGPLSSGERFNLIAEIDIPASAMQGDTVGATITATSYYSALAFDIATDVITVSEMSSLDIGLAKLTMQLGEKQDFLSIGLAGENQLSYYGNISWEVLGGIGAIDSYGVFTATSAGLGAIVLRDLSGAMPTVSQIVDVLGPAGGVTQNETGTLLNSYGQPPPDDQVQFQAYITSRPSEVLTQEAPGSGYGGGQWQVNVGNFHTPWAVFDILHVDFTNLADGEVDSVEYVLTNEGQSHAVQLPPLSYTFETTPKTDVNSFVLHLDTGVTDAEGLVSSIPNATEIAYWDAHSQAYVAHTRGLSLFNFPVAPGHPYFVTVTANTLWTPGGSVPSTSFNLITTGNTDVNMVGIPFRMSRIKKAEELCIVIPGCTEVAYWDTLSQAYIAHTRGVPLFNFDVGPGLPVFITVTEESLWP